MPINTIPTPPFPLYLLPSIPFRRRRRSSTSTTTSHASNPTLSPSSSPSASPPHPSYLTRTPTSHLRCTKCLADLIPTTSIISKGFTGRHGRAYLVAPPPRSAFFPHGLPADDLPNTLTHKPVPRQLVTGAHTVSDISCRTCGSVLGWKYVDAEEESQRYKVGKYILETRRVVRGVGWEAEAEGEKEAEGDREGDREGGRGRGSGGGKEAEDGIEFDSQDEDECEDLFSGIWSAGLAGRRRANRVGEIV